MRRLKYGPPRANGSRPAYYRHKGGGLTRLPDLPENDPRFLAAYAAAAQAVPTRKGLAHPDSLKALCAAYMASHEWSALAEATREQRRRIMDRIVTKAGTAQANLIRRDHIEKDLRDLPPHPARNRLKTWRGLMAFAVRHGKIERDPTEGVKPPAPPKSDGFPMWTLDEIEAFRAHWPIGSEPRLAMEVCYWTAAAAVDAVRLGRQMLDKDGWLRFQRTKTGTAVEIPFLFLPGWMEPDFGADHLHMRAAIEAAAGRMLFLETAHGRPRSVKAFSTWLARKAVEAGLPSRRAPHGLRKARLTRAAEAGWSVHQIMSWAGHLSADEAILYTRQAQRRSILAGTKQEERSAKRGTGDGQNWNG